MKLFYGVQGTGNGHITRARMMAKALYNAGVEVDFLFTGREAGQYFEMDIFRDYAVKSGLTFSVKEGQVQYFKTALTAKPMQFFKDIASLDLSGYDLVISDFEPVTAWAARKQKRQVIGIGHQYAFNYPIPKAGVDPVGAKVMANFAPVDIGVGLHWHHFGLPILPPIIETPEPCQQLNTKKIIVYLPFETNEAIIRLLAPFKAFEFHIYCANPQTTEYSHLMFKQVSRETFRLDYYDSVGIISNAGFELASESLQSGKKILAKPLHAQLEQISNAHGLKHLGYGKTMFELDQQVVEAWLHSARAVRVTYPNVAEILVKWIQQGTPVLNDEFIASVWSQVDVLQVQHA